MLAGDLEGELSVERRGEASWMAHKGDQIEFDWLARGQPDERMMSLPEDLAPTLAGSTSANRPPRRRAPYKGSRPNYSQYSCELQRYETNWRRTEIDGTNIVGVLHWRKYIGQSEFNFALLA